MSVGIFVQYFRRKLLQFECKPTMLNLVMSRFLSLTKLYSAASFTRAPHYSTLSFTYVEDKTAFCIYLDSHDFKVSLLLPHAC